MIVIEKGEKLLRAKLQNHCVQIEKKPNEWILQECPFRDIVCSLKCPHCLISKNKTNDFYILVINCGNNQQLFLALVEDK